MNWKEINTQFIDGLKGLSFEEPVTHVYNPMTYAKKSYDTYLNRYGKNRKEIIFLGMNPGPWGMVQTGIPFGEIDKVKFYLKILEGVSAPDLQHPKRPITGFECTRHEVSGKRLWTWAQEEFGTPQQFFQRFFVANYCPLAFMEAGGKNRTPDKLKKPEREKLFAICDQALRETVSLLKPKWVIGVGKFAEKRALAALGESGVKIGSIAHPSPANPQANKGWSQLVNRQLEEMGVLKVDLD
jgi:single-strand selective monofunctional uracil DNA glycosylase